MIKRIGCVSRILPMSTVLFTPFFTIIFLLKKRIVNWDTGVKKLTVPGLLSVFLFSGFSLTGCSSRVTEKIGGSAGLVYELSEDGTYYEMVDGKSCTEGITEYGEGSLGALSYVEKIVLPDGVESLGTAAFLLNFSMKEVVIGKGLKRIEVDSFEMQY